MTYAILECNMERLTKKLTTIKNKCEKYGIEFHFEEVGEEFRTVKNENDEEEVLRYVLVEAEGKADGYGGMEMLSFFLAMCTAADRESNAEKKYM